MTLALQQPTTAGMRGSEAIEHALARIILGESPVIRQLRARIARIAPTGLPVLIEGPTGSGKELVARALHLASGRLGDLVSFNVCAIAETMFEDALFGHVRGAFTGAIASSRGFLVEAHGGTVFFDEASGLSLTSQAKLLRALESKAFRPVGARHDTTSDFRLVAATNERLGELVAAGRFRTDLAYRLSACVIRVPALCERNEDIAPLARHFLSTTAASRSGDLLRLGESAIAALEAYGWPGNVRELLHVVACAAAFATSAEIRRDDILGVLPSASAVPTIVMDALSRRRLLEVLEEAEWNVRVAADRLGVHATTVYRRMRRWQLLPPGLAPIGRARAVRASTSTPEATGMRAEHEPPPAISD